MSRTTWVPGAAGSGYDVDNLPYGVFGTGTERPRVGVRIGDHVLDLAAAARLTHPAYDELVDATALDALMAAGPDTWAEVRAWIVDLLTDPVRQDELELVPLADAVLRLPWTVGDFVDFYASEHHASNVGRIFRPDAEPLRPNWRHLPVGYHGRAGSVVVSGTDVRRPCGQRAGDGPGRGPTYGPSERLDLEAELGFVVGRSVPHGERVPTADYERTVFGVTGVNDWSARDLQAWEYVPLGPHLGKSFATSVGAWVTPLAALEHARVPMPVQEPAVLPYLVDEPRTGYDITVDVEIGGTVVTRAPYAAMYWSPAQLLAHLTVNGASLRVGDLFASGTVSGPRRDQVGSLLELSWGGTEPWRGGPAWLADGDEVVLRYSAPGARGTTGRIGLGEVRGRVVAAQP